MAAAYATNDYDDEPVPGKFDEAKQTWSPTDPQTTIEQTITIRVDRAEEQGEQSLITGAELGSVTLTLTLTLALTLTLTLNLTLSLTLTLTLS